MKGEQLYGLQILLLLKICAHEVLVIDETWSADSLGHPASCSSSVIRLTASSLKGVGFAPPPLCVARGV